jgi:hypothetical protein
MRGVLSYKSIGRETIRVDVEGRDQEELLANARKAWEEAPSNKDESKRPESEAKPNFHF